MTTERYIEKLGPIVGRINLPREPGIWQLVGDNGTGKTTALTAIEACGDGKENAKARKRLEATNEIPGQPVGMICLDGRKVRVGRNVTARGDLGCRILPGECSPEALAECPIEDKARRAAAQTRILLQMRGVQFTEAQWREVFGAEDDVALPADIDPEDPVGTAELLRNALHDKALPLEKESASLEARAAGKLEGIDVTKLLPVNVEQLRLEANESATSLALTKQKAKTATEAREQADAAREKLVALDATLPDVDLWKASTAEADRDLTAAIAKVDRLENELNEARREMAAAKESATQARARHDEAKQLNAQADALRTVIEAGGAAEGPTPEDIAAEEESAKAAQDAVAAGIKTAADIKTKAEADELKKQAAAALDKSVRFRRFAKLTDEALTKALDSAGIEGVSTVDGRLCITNGDGKRELYDALSEGEKWDFAVQQAAAELSPGDIVVINHSGWSAMNQPKKELASRLFTERGLCGFTEQMVTGEVLHLERFEEAEQTKEPPK